MAAFEPADANKVLTRDLILLSHLTALLHLDLRGCDRLAALAPLSPLASLRRLDASFCSELASLGGIEHLARLEFLDLSAGPKISDRDLVHLGGCRRLRTLHLNGCSEVTGEGLRHLHPCPLTRLDLGSCNRLADEALANIAAHCTALTDLDISSSSRVTDQGLRCLAASSALRLHSLNVSYCYQLSDAAVPLLAALPYLRALSMKGLHVSNITPLIERIRGTYYGHVHDNGFQHGGDGHVHVYQPPTQPLRVLDIRGCQRLTQDGNGSGLMREIQMALQESESERRDSSGGGRQQLDCMGPTISTSPTTWTGDARPAGVSIRHDDALALAMELEKVQCRV